MSDGGPTGFLEAQGGSADSCYVENHMLNFAQIAHCFPGKIYPTDVDGIVEMGGSFLAIEWKDTRRTGTGPGDWRGGDFPVPQTGQLLALQAMSRLPDFTVLVIYGDGATMTPGSVSLVSQR